MRHQRLLQIAGRLQTPGLRRPAVSDQRINETHRTAGRGTAHVRIQNRSLDGDVKSNLCSIICRHAPNIDLLRFDILNERLGVHKLPDGNYITGSAALARNGRMDGVAGPMVKFGTDRHYNLWRKAAGVFVRNIDAAGILDKTLLIETPWADVTDTGTPVPRFRGISAVEANEAYERYYQVLRGAGIRTARIPDQMAVSTEDHKWGPGQYHYAPPAYEWMRDRIVEA